MAQINLGRVAYVNKGIYGENVVYEKYDVVLYNNGSYVYWNDTKTSGHLPTDTNYFKVMLDPTLVNLATDNANTAASTANTAAANADTARANLNTSIATTEASSTASSPHAVGSYLFLNGTLYEVTVAIAVGDTITVGTNVATVPGGLSGEVSDLKSAFDAAESASIFGNPYPNNLVIAIDCVDNQFIDYTDGTIGNGSSYFRTGYIAVTAGTQYKSNKGRNYAWYNSSKVFISGGSGTGIQSGITAPENAAYIRFTVNKSADGIETPYRLYFAAVSSFDTSVTPDRPINGYAKLASKFGKDVVNYDVPLQNVIGCTKFPNNLINVNDCVDNQFIDYSNGNIGDASGYFRTGYIAVTAGTSYKSNVGRNYAWYNSSKTYISGEAGASIQTGITAPSTAAYIRFTVNKSTDGIDNPYELYFATTANYNSDVYIQNLSGFAADEKVFGERVVAERISLSKVIGVTKFPGNLVDPVECVNNQFIDYSNGNIGDASGYFRTGYIPVTASVQYKSNKGRNYAWYTSGKTYISGESGTGIQSGITAPSTAAFIRFTVNKSTDGISSPFDLYFAAISDYDSKVTIPDLFVSDALPWCYGKKINWIGDSIVDGQDFDEEVCTALNLTKLTTDGEGGDGGINGSTIALKSDGTDGRNALCERYDDMPDGADLIAVSAGTNDWMYAWCPIGTINDPDDGTSNNTFYGALKALCKGLIDKYPQKVIFFTTPIKRAQAFSDGNGGEYTQDGVMTTPFSKNKYGKTLMDYADMIIEVCGYYSIPVLDMYRESLLNPHITAQQNMFDNVYTHPNSTGQKIMARRVCGWLTQLGYTIA